MKNDKKNENYDDFTQNPAGYRFEWNPDSGDIDDIPVPFLRAALKILDNDLVKLEKTLDNKGQIQLSFDGYCRSHAEGQDRGEYADNSFESTVTALRDPESRTTVHKSVIFPTGYSPSRYLRTVCPGCNAAVCPYIVAGRLKYLRDLGKLPPEDELLDPDSRKKIPAILSEDDYGFDLKEFFFEYLSFVSDDIFDVASYLASNRFISLGKELFSDNDVKYCRIFCAFDLEDFKNASKDGSYTKVAATGKKMTWYDTTRLRPTAGTEEEWEKILIAGALLECAETCARDISKYINARQNARDDIGKLAAEVSGIDRIMTMAANEKNDFLRCTVEGEYERGRADTVKKIASMLSLKGKISTPEVFEVTFGELAHELTEYLEITDRHDNNDLRSHHKIYPGYHRRTFEPRKMYMVTDLSGFLRDRDADSDSMDIKRIEMVHLINVLGTVENDTYVCVVGYKNEIDRFLAIDSKIGFLFGANRLVYPDMTTHEIYEMYVKGLSSDVAAKIKDPEENEQQFTDYLTFNSRAIPFDNDELAEYLSAFSNAEGSPILPPGIYDKNRLKDKMSKVIGMESIKEQITHFENYIAFRKKCEANKRKLPDANLHMLFTGNAGTGKTMIARMISTMLYEIGFLPEDKLVEVERKDLVANYLGQTAGKTAGKIQDAIGGVLFIDEAYALAGDQYGEEAIATLLKAMEDHRNDLVVIFAGYSDKMQKFIDTNPGLSSRIGYKFHFDDYSYDELMQMLDLKASSADLAVTKQARERAGLVVKYFMRRKNFGNGRFINTLWQEMIIRHSACKNQNLLFVIDENDVPSVTSFSTRRDSAPKELKLEDLVGLAQVKEQVRRFRNKISFEKRAREFGVSIPRGNSHMMFTGNAGTGKTTVARILVRELYEAGVIVENKLIEVTAGDLIGEYVGQTAPKTQAVIDRAMGGVLFIDEAYALAGTGRTADYGQDAVATLIKAMEDNRDQFVVIFAGYTEEMKNFLAMNTGISSRIGYTFRFEDYNTDELTEIYKMKINAAGLVLADEETENSVKALMQYFVSVPNFGNGRFSEKVSDATFTIHAENCADSDDPAKLVSVTKEDIPSIEYMIAMMPDGNLLKPSEITEAENLRTAYHETGHAFVMLKLFPDAELSRITIAAEGSGALGYVSTAGLTKNMSTSDELKRVISVYMAGIASEKVMTGDYANGGTSDIEKATETAWSMISRYGMSESGFAARKTKDEKANEEINKLLKEGFENAEQMIRDNRDKVEKAAALLIRNKTITEEELRAVAAE